MNKDRLKQKLQEKKGACTLEAKLCPDGSSVGRIGPNCEFAQCPDSAIDSWETYTSPKYKYSFRYPSNYQVNESNDYLTIVNKEGQYDFLTSVDPLRVDEQMYKDSTREETISTPSTLSFEEYASVVLLPKCLADGQNHQLFCDKILDKQPFISTPGVNGYKIMLNQIDKEYKLDGSVQIVGQKPVGPYYIFDMGTSNSGGLRAIEIEAFDEDGQDSGEKKKQIVEQLAKSFKKGF